MQRFLTFCLVFLKLSCFSQSIQISDGAYIRIYGSGKLIVSSGLPNSILKYGNTGGIWTDSEASVVVFTDVTSTGAFTVPFVSSIGETIPFTYNITTAGTGTGELRFTTYETPDDNTPYPNGVTSFSYGSFDNSSTVIDRFWIIDPTGYTTKPQGTYTFTYSDNDLVGNTCSESLLFAQRWNSDANAWGDWLYSPTVDPVADSLQIFIQNPLDQYAVWTLVDQGSPLAIKLILFRVECPDNILVWKTASETNNEGFLIQGTNDGVTYTDVEWVPGAGNSNTMLSYEYRMPLDATQYLYYRLKQIDYDGSFSISSLVNGCFANEVERLLLYPNPNHGTFSINLKGVCTYNLINVLGQILWSYTGEVHSFDFSRLPTGHYWMSVHRNDINIGNTRFLKLNK
jgi:hypothetical protein